MFLYTPKNIADILLMKESRITKPTTPTFNDTLNINQVFRALNNNREFTNDPRALSIAAQELETIGYKDHEVVLFAFELLKCCEKSIETIDISSRFLRPADMPLPPIKREVLGNFDKFMGTEFQFRLYGQNVTNKVFFDPKQLEQHVYSSFLDTMTELNQSEPGLFNKSFPKNNLDLGMN